MIPRVPSKGPGLYPIQRDQEGNTIAIRDNRGITGLGYCLYGALNMGIWSKWVPGDPELVILGPNPSKWVKMAILGVWRSGGIMWYAGWFRPSPMDSQIPCKRPMYFPGWLGGGPRAPEGVQKGSKRGLFWGPKGSILGSNGSEAWQPRIQNA